MCETSQHLIESVPLETRLRPPKSTRQSDRGSLTAANHREKTASAKIPVSTLDAQSCVAVLRLVRGAKRASQFDLSLVFLSAPSAPMGEESSSRTLAVEQHPRGCGQFLKPCQQSAIAA